MAIRHAIVAGNGRLPMELAEHLAANGATPVVMRVAGEADPALAAYEGAEFTVNTLPRVLPAILKAGCDRVTLAGGITRRPEPLKLRVPVMLWADLPLGLARLKAGDNAMLATMVWLFEKHGVRVVGAHEIKPDLLIGEGPLDPRMARPDKEKLASAMRAALGVGELDIGQAVVAIGPRIVAVEGAEGTDQMINRVADLRQQRRIGKEPAILAKAVKPQQERRVDLPTIGPNTVANAAKAGVNVIAVTAGTTLLMDGAEALRLALEHGITIIGVDVAQGASA